MAVRDHMRVSRRAFLAAAAMAPLALGGCVRMPDLNVRMPWDARTVSGSDDALALMTEELGERFGSSFVRAGGLDPLDDTADGTRNLTHYLAPEDDPSKVFAATVVTDAASGAVRGHTLTDWPQYLFLDEFLAPAKDSLPKASGLAGWGLRMGYVRYDDRAWHEGELEEYVGGNFEGGPEVTAYLMLPLGGSNAEWAKALKEAGDGLYATGRNVNVYATIEGRSFSPSPAYVAAQTYNQGRGRTSTPDIDEIQKSLEAWGVPADAPSWDGTSTGGDPGDERYLPQITWNPGHGPEAW